MKVAIRRPLSLIALCLGLPAMAQQIDLSLHPTAVPDSFEVRATATSWVFTAIPNGVFTLRWELASGGVANNGDIRRPCGAFPIINYGGTVDIGAYRYFTLVLLADRPMSQAGCPIGTEGTTLCGVRIRELSGCRNVALVQNAYTGMNNLDYYFSVGGVEVTGSITSTPIPGGDCSGCVPPVIQSMQVGDLPECGSGPLDFSVSATGTDLEYNWQSPTGAWIGYEASGVLNNGVSGLYRVSVSNSCGTAVDSALTGFNPDLCDPAQLGSVWFEMLPPAAQQMRLHSAGTGSCLSYRWIRPNGAVMNSANPVSGSTPAIPGIYTFILLSACGTDTLQLELTPEMVCLSPMITSVTSDAPQQLCNLEPFSLNVQSTLTPTFVWTGPDGVWNANGASVLLDPPQHGLYRVRAIDDCGMDSAFYWVELDTAGLAACVPPVIHGITSEPVCMGDTLWIHADVELSGPCSSLHWSGTGAWGTAPTLMLPYAGTHAYMLELSNACGSVSMSHQPQVTAFDNLFTIFCGIEGPFNLDSAYADFLVEGGQWWVNGSPVLGVYDPILDTNMQYYYRWPNGCDRLGVFVNDYPLLNAGMDAHVRICSDAAPVDLFPLLGPDAQAGGSWTYAFDVQLPGGIYDPAAFIGAFTRVFSYSVGTWDDPCRHTAYVTVEEVDGPFPWYADTDGDGLGDPLDSLMSCDPVAGYVAVGGDACPLVFGTVGDPCDDGNPLTSNDSLTVACTCAGDLGTGMPEVSGGGWSLWPNPNRGGAFFLQQPSGSGVVRITVMDATGRVLHRSGAAASAAPLEVLLPNGVAAGTYFVGIVGEAGSSVLRMVVE